MRQAAFIIAALAAWSLAGRAQQPPAQPPVTFRAGVDLVEVDVSVLDKNRRPVRDLTRPSPSRRSTWQNAWPPRRARRGCAT
jgi:hypothetical protein